MDRVPTTTTCRCGYASPATLPRCLGCGRRFGRCERIPAPAPRPAAETLPAARSRRAEAPFRLVESRPAPRPTAASRRPAAQVDPIAEVASFSGRDAARFGAPPITPAPIVVLPTGALAVLGMVAASWIGPEGPRPELLTAAALLGAGLSLARQTSPARAPEAPPLPALVLPSRLTDDELRDAITAW